VDAEKTQRPEESSNHFEKREVTIIGTNCFNRAISSGRAKYNADRQAGIS